MNVTLNNILNAITWDKNHPVESREIVENCISALFEWYILMDSYNSTIMAPTISSDGFVMIQNIFHFHYTLNIRLSAEYLGNDKYRITIPISRFGLHMTFCEIVDKEIYTNVYKDISDTVYSYSD